MPRTRETKWAKLGVQRRPNNVRDLLEDVANITVATGHRYVWRGVKDAHFLLHSSLQRRLANAGDAITVGNLVAHERTLLDRAKAAGFQFRGRRELQDSDLLALLQHAGASTTLLDVTPDPYVALFFATEPVGPLVPSALIAIKIPGATPAEQAAHTVRGPIPEHTLPGSMTIAMNGIYECLGALTTHAVPPGDAILWEAPFVDMRMQAQKGMFLATTAVAAPNSHASFNLPVGTPAEERTRGEQLARASRGQYQRPTVVVFYLSTRIRGAITEELDARFSYRTETIYPDLAGYALANAANRRF